jgi:hypothetical protein
LNAGYTSQTANSIVLFGNNSTGAYLNAAAQGTFISPIRLVATNANMLAYNTEDNTKKIGATFILYIMYIK